MTREKKARPSSASRVRKASNDLKRAMARPSDSNPRWGASETCERLLDDPEFRLAGLSPLVISGFVLREHSIILFVIARASKSEHVGGFINFPPCPGSLEPYVTDEFVGAFDSPASDGISTTSGFPVIQAM